jgi:phage tail sheath protein FI
MPSALTYPGIYIEEIPSGVHPITGVSTSDTAFCDFFARGPVNAATRITSFADFQRQFGGLDTRSEASYAIQQFYLNGGQVAWVIRVVTAAATKASVVLPPHAGTGSGMSGSGPIPSGMSGIGGGNLTIEAASEGAWGNNVQIGIDYNTANPAAGNQFNLVVRELETLSNGRIQVRSFEVFRNLVMDDTTSAQYAPTLVNHASGLIDLLPSSMGQRPGSTHSDAINAVGKTSPADPDFTKFISLGQAPAARGKDGDPPDANALLGVGQVNGGINALNTIAPFIFNLLCLPAAANLADGGANVYSKALAYCESKRAFLIADPPRSLDNDQDDVKKKTHMITFKNNLDVSRNGAIYFPRMRMPDPLRGNVPQLRGPSGTMAGVYARTDSARGVWKAPAGVDANLLGVELDVILDDLSNGDLNQIGINVLRNFPIFGNVSWGARTLEGADIQASEYKYIPVRRTALFIEESLYEGLKWVVFEPNDEPLWSQIRLNVGAFMNGLFRQGAFQGKTPREAFLVKCDSETTTPTDQNLGIVNILVAFAPLKPAEFVVIKIQQLAGQVQA